MPHILTIIFFSISAAAILSMCVIIVLQSVYENGYKAGKEEGYFEGKSVMLTIETHRQKAWKTTDNYNGIW